MDILEALGKTPSDGDHRKALEYQKDKEAIQKQAEAMGKEAKHHLHVHHVLSRSVTMFQIAIATGAISVLTRRRTFWLVSLAFGLVGLFFGMQSFIGGE